MASFRNLTKDKNTKGAILIVFFDIVFLNNQIIIPAWKTPFLKKWFFNLFCMCKCTPRSCSQQTSKVNIDEFKSVSVIQEEALFVMMRFNY